MDYVPNHSSEEHAWFKKSVDGEEPYKDYYVWLDGKCQAGAQRTEQTCQPPNNWVNFKIITFKLFELFF